MTEGTSSLIQTLLWISFFGLILWRTRSHANTLLNALVKRVLAGAPIGLGPVSIGEAPAAIRDPLDTTSRAVTPEGVGGAGTPQDLEECLERKQYPKGISDSLYLVHAAEIATVATPSGKPLFRVRVWVEADSKGLLEEVEHVTYRLHNTFPNRVVATSARGRNFELWLTVYGEFCIVAFVQRKSGEPLWLTRYLELPGRPPD